MVMSIWRPPPPEHVVSAAGQPKSAPLPFLVRSSEPVSVGIEQLLADGEHHLGIQLLTHRVRDDAERSALRGCSLFRRCQPIGHHLIDGPVPSGD